MTGEEHYKEAARLLERESEFGYDDQSLALVTEAQAHATLALAAFTKRASDRDHDPDRYAVGPR